MDNLLAGLDKLGINMDNLNNIYDEPESTKAKDNVNEEKKTNVIDESELIFEKTMSCPVCGKEFKSKAVRTGKAKLVNTDTDLKPNYQGFEPLKYDVIVCLHCGYAAVGRTFSHITPAQSKLIRENISRGFKGMTNTSGIYTFNDAIERHKLALANAIVMHAKNSERAYLCLKMGWLYRSMYKGIPEGDEKLEKMRQEFIEEEKKYIKSAYDGFSVSFSKEVPPICGMDENTLTYLLADLARRCGEYDNSRKYLTMVLTSRTATLKLKERARELKEIIGQDANGK